MNDPIVDSSLSIQIALKQNPGFFCPKEILESLVLIDVRYYSFDQKVHIGQLVIHQDLANDVAGAFELLLQEKFPVQSVIPISNDKFAWDDSVSTATNNSSAFNYRYVRGTNVLSNHAQGRAIDINPRLNPYFPGTKVFPPHASYDPDIPGTILANSKLVKYLADLGWRWGGTWNEDLDYQHFEKL